MRFSLAIVPAFILASTVFALEQSISEAQNVKDIDQRLVEDEASQLDFNSIIEEMEEGFYSVHEDDEQDSETPLDENDSKNPLYRVEKDFGVIEVDLKPILNIFYNLLKPIDFEQFRNKLLETLFGTFKDPLFEIKSPNSNKSLEKVIKSVLKGVNPFENKDGDEKAGDEKGDEKDED